MRPLAFSMPGGRASRVRLSFGRTARHPARLAVRVAAFAVGGGAASRRVRIRIGHRTSASGRNPARRSAPTPPRSEPATAPLIGLSDQEPGTFRDRLFTALPIVTARIIVPWNVQRTEPARLDAWLAAARDAGVEPLVALGHARGDRCPDSPCRLPDVADYAAAVRALVRNSSVRQITPWNEPNHGSQPTATAPRRAAAYYGAARAACPECTLVAGDVLDAPGFLAWIREYRRTLVEEPAVWGLHNYFDTTYARSDGIDGLLAEVAGEVWLTETGGIVRHHDRHGRVSLPADEQRAARGVQRAIALADARAARVRRVYIYQWRAAEAASFDAGLLAPDGTPRSAYGVLRGALSARVPGTKPQVAARAGAPRMVMRGRVRLTGRRIRLTLGCATYEVARCEGRLSVESASWRGGTLVNGHPRGRWIRPASRSVRLRATTVSTVTVRLPRQPSPRRRHRLRVSVHEPTAASELVVNAIVSPRPGA